MKKSDLNRHMDLLLKTALEELKADFQKRKIEAIKKYVDSLRIESEIKKAESLTRLLITELEKIDSKISLEHRYYGIISIDKLQELLTGLNSPVDYVFNQKKTENLSEFINLEKLEKSTKATIVNAYETLRQNVSTYRTAYDAIPYLESMGITVPEEEKLQVMLIKPVDPKLLKYKGE